MSNELLKIAFKAASKVIPTIADVLSTKEHVVANLTSEELVAVFLNNPCNPKCLVIDTKRLPPDVLRVSFEYFARIKSEVSRSVTTDGWHVLLADKPPPTWIGWGVFAQHHLILLAVKGSQHSTRVIIGCRFITQYKTDLLGKYAQASTQRVGEIATLIEPMSAVHGFWR